MELLSAPLWHHLVWDRRHPHFLFYIESREKPIFGSVGGHSIRATACAWRLQMPIDSEKKQGCSAITKKSASAVGTRVYLLLIRLSTGSPSKWNFWLDHPDTVESNEELLDVVKGKAKKATREGVTLERDLSKDTLQCGKNSTNIDQPRQVNIRRSCTRSYCTYSYCTYSRTDEQ